MSVVKEKIFILLIGLLAAGFSYTPRQQAKAFKFISYEWGKINENEIRKEIKNLYRSKLIKRKENPDGTITLLLTDKGKIKALNYKFEEMRIKNQKWDGKWRLVVFDIPEKLRWGRDAIRRKLKDLGFWELQKSVFVFPYECKNEIDFIIEIYQIRKFVRYGVLESIDNEKHLKEIYKL